MRRFALMMFVLFTVVALGSSSLTASSSIEASAAPSIEPRSSASTTASPALVPGTSPPTATVAPTVVPSATPVPTAPSDLTRRVTDEFDGIRIEIELQRNPLPAGQRSWVKTTVTNDGNDGVTWFHDGCAQLASIHGVSAAEWSMGIEHEGQAAMFKTYVLGGHIAQEPRANAWLSVVREERLGRGQVGCADLGMADTIKPGESLEQTRWWSGFTAIHEGPAPAGPATIFVHGGGYSRDSSPEAGTAHVFELQIDAWISSGDTRAQLSPAQIVDAALADPAFAAYLETQSIADGRAEIAWYDADHGYWEIGVMPWYETTPPRIHGVLVDPFTGTILGPLDRDWDEDIDPFP